MSEIDYQRTDDGRFLAWVFAAGDRNLLRRCSDCLVTELGAQPTERFDGMDQIFLDFILAGVPIVLQWTQGRGVAVGADASSEESRALVQRVARYLGERVVP
ncbi:MAG: hypothetical protein ACOY0T_18970 [Myxococcota bacterium]